MVKDATTLPSSKAEYAPETAGSKNTLVLFDFDGTITTRDTLAEVLIFYRGKARYWMGLALMSPVLALYAMKLLPNWRSKQYLLSFFFRGEEVGRFNEQCRKFADTVVPQLVRPQALAAIRAYRSSGFTVAVVSASAENWIKPWCQQHGLHCLATRLEVRNNRITGKFDGRNCHGDEKVCRVREHFALDKYAKIIAFGDSAGDKEMLALAHEKHYKPFRH